MSWELYEVWAVSEDYEVLVDTTKSLKEARLIAKKQLTDGAECVKIMAEDDGGATTEIEKLSS